MMGFVNKFAGKKKTQEADDPDEALAAPYASRMEKLFGRREYEVLLELADYAQTELKAEGYTPEDVVRALTVAMTRSLIYERGVRACATAIRRDVKLKAGRPLRENIKKHSPCEGVLGRPKITGK